MIKIRLLFICTLLYLIPNCAIGQNNLLDLLANAQEADEKLPAIYDLNVFSYFNLSDYDTELKMSVFKRTEEYQNKLSELNKLRAKMFETVYYKKLEDKFDGISYNMKRQGFALSFGENSGSGTYNAHAPKSYDGVIFKSLPTKQIPEPEYGPGLTMEELFVPMSEENALEIENDNSEIVLYLLFSPTGRETTTFKYYNMGNRANTGWYNMSRDNIKCEDVKIVVANDKTGKILFNKNYSYVKPKQLK